MPPQPPPPLNLGDISAGPIGPDEPDAETLKEEKELEQDEDIDAQERRALLDSINLDIELRRRYAGRIFWLVVGWLIGVGVLLLLDGALSPWKLFSLPSSVLIAAISGTTINVIGIFVIVARYLFPQRPLRQPQERRPARQRR